MKNRRLRDALATVACGLSVGALAVGCSSSSPGPTSSVAATSFSGIYVTNSVGGVQQFEFVDSSHVNVWWASCANGRPCEANDTYVLTGDQLVISEPGGNTTKIILSGIQSGVGTAYDPIHPLGTLGGGGGVSLGSDGGTSLTGSGDASLIGSQDAALTSGVTVTIVITFTITIVIEVGVSLTGEGGTTEAGAADGGTVLTSDGSVQLVEGGVLNQGEGGTGSSGGSGTGSSAGSGSGSSGSGSSGSGSGSSGGGGSGTGSSVGSGSGSSSGSGSGEAICSQVTSQTFKSASTFPNDKTSFDYLLSQGLNATQAAGVIGNLDQESGDSPTCYQGPNGCSSSPVKGYPGAGIAQWSVGGRWDSDSNDNAKAYAQQQGESVTSLQLQLQFLWHELSSITHYGLASLEQQSTITEAAQVFATDFEACGTCDQTNRIKYGQNAYNAFSNDQTPSGGSDGGMCIQTYGTCSASGSSGNCIDTGACSSSSGTSTAGHCPGPSNIQCCTH